MNKSHLGNTEDPQKDLVTSNDIEKLVDVLNVGKGFLRYVGAIHGKEGLFCGIELLEPNGKHDGSFQGISYFIATPQHGIFAPVFRVTLDADERRNNLPKVNAEQKLSRSALPALNLRNSFTESCSDGQPKPISDPMTTSVYSKPINIPQRRPTTEMEMSMFSDMMDGSMFSNGSWSDIADSMITSNCTFTVRKCPQIPADDDGDLMSAPMVQSVLNIDREALRREEQLQTSMVLPESRIGVEFLPVIEDENELETPLVEVKSFEKEVETPQVEIAPPQPEIAQVPDVPKASNESKIVEEKKEVKPAVKKVEKTPPAPAPMKKQIIVEPAAPKFPVKPKAPTKHQIMMEQLKASIEAEKNKPKKEVKSRVSIIPPSTPQDENASPRKPTITKKLPPAPIVAPPIERPKKERKPLYTAPPPKAKIEPPKKVTAPSQIATTSGFPTSSFAGARKTSSISGSEKDKPVTVTRTSKATSAAKKVLPTKKTIAEKEKLRRLQKSATATEALIIVLRNLEKQYETRMNEMNLANDEKSKQVEILNSKITEEKQRLETEIEKLNNSNQQVIRGNAKQIEELKERHELQLLEKSKEYDRNIEDERARREAEAIAMSSRHQKVVACLDEKIGEAEKLCEELKNDKKNLQAALANDCDHRNQMLTKEISSLQTALEMKSAEMKELRQKNQNLSLQVDEIPLKELEISKWRHKANEYKQMLDQKINGEKILVLQIEEMRRKQHQDEEEKDAMRKSFDLYQYRLENGEDPNQNIGTPTKVQFRSKSSASGTRPPSMNTIGEQRMSTTSDYDRDSMTRSTISMYMSQVRLPENHAEDVIYAPDEIISSRDGSICQRLAIAIENNGEPMIQSESSDHSDSGIGIVM
ncbi:unnamed protein product [Caenorhabditis angaria]|uniref:CAP-Gly domain-containing protein n=1 Tax=Caenorhabditis angaria TaxID=860376 RepID=A0A9P1N061_9PELO|nr:unnamed protein product [Caenorhabditis angaria]